MIFKRREEIYMHSWLVQTRALLQTFSGRSNNFCGTIAAVFFATIIGYTIVFIEAKAEAYGIVVSPIISFLQVYGASSYSGLIAVQQLVISAFYCGNKKYLKHNSSGLDTTSADTAKQYKIKAKRKQLMKKINKKNDWSRCDIQKPWLHSVAAVLPKTTARWKEYWSAW